MIKLKELKLSESKNKSNPVALHSQRKYSWVLLIAVLFLGVGVGFLTGWVVRNISADSVAVECGSSEFASSSGA